MQYKSDLSLSNKTFSYNQPDISNNSEEIHREQWFPAAEKEAEEIAVHEAAQTQWAEEPVWVPTVLWTHNHPHGLADALLVVQYGSDYPFPIHIQWQSHHAKFAWIQGIPGWIHSQINFPESCLQAGPSSGRNHWRIILTSCMSSYDCSEL